ncbi:MAG TPA: hypothetical protein PLS88_04450 [Rectinema sp.]|jgi:hypothetical protein|nr:hypothetical protein [Spirochaetota bacterium]NLH88734.1 hypothetical protein [Treponema sp.]HNV36698.1 hypothetical protein [Rectinema sp.]HOC27855.1 hypothetical protein [Rectinema sp.]HOU06628.1 hypothetical protein [Rectinema sp.]
MDKTEISFEKKPAIVRRLSSLAGIRRELARVYEEAKGAGADSERVQYYRALTFILTSCAEVLRNEKIEKLEDRLQALEAAKEEAEEGTND